MTIFYTPPLSGDIVLNLDNSYIIPTSPDIVLDLGYSIYRLELDSLSLTSSTSSVTLLSNKRVILGSNSFSTSNKDVSFVLTRRFLIESTGYTLSSNYNLLLTKLLSIDSNSFSYNLKDISFSRVRTLSIESSNIHSSLSSISLLSNRSINIDKMDYSLDEKDVLFKKNSIFPIDSSSISLDSDVSILLDRRLVLSASNYSSSLSPIILNRIRKISLDSINLGLNLGDIFNLIYRGDKSPYRHLIMSVPDRSIGVEEGLKLLVQTNPSININTLNSIHSLIINKH